ncbi:MAG: nucleotide-diphospho-sugar transferase [Candidatus Taylorbacteria bacterium]
MKDFKTPILLIIFNRPDTTSVVFEAIRQIRPRQLFIAADGPRLDKPEDNLECRASREIVEYIDWPCEVKKLFRDKNLGCGHGVSTAINWFFENVEEGIILEDDCLPDQSFFRFCEELLKYYRENERIMHISGNNFQSGKKRGNSSYYFSEYTHNWGWATWKRAWEYNDFHLIDEKRRLHIWDKQWMISVRKRNGLAVLPNVNLVSNIGFGENSTHTKGDSKFSRMPTEKMQFPLLHPRKIRRNIQADFLTCKEVFNGNLGKFIFDNSLRYIPKSFKSFVKNI